MIHIGLFEGIGGFSLAAQWMGWETLVTCEINPFGQKVLQYYWPQAYHHADIHSLTYETINAQLSERFGTGWRNEDVIITGGFPCQPFSLAGKRKGTEDNRHLWPEMLRVIREVQPEWILGENVFGLINWDAGLVFDQVQADLEAEGYEVQAYVLPAVSVNAPHRRDRVWFVAYSINTGNRTSRNGNNENGKEIIEEREYSQFKSNRLNKTSPNSISYGHTPCGKSEGIEGNGSGNNGKQNERIEQTERLNGLHGFSRNATDTQCEGFQKPEQSGQHDQLLNAERNDLQDVADTINQRLQGVQLGRTPEQGEGRKQTFRPIAQFYKGNNWRNFPTVSPVHVRNDGISDRLSGITFPKWRNEGIKAMGNAIVPQVAFQIFKTIEKYKSLTQ